MDVLRSFQFPSYNIFSMVTIHSVTSNTLRDAQKWLKCTISCCNPRVLCDFHFATLTKIPYAR